MNSLIDYVGIFGAPGDAPESGEYLNRMLPGMPLESIVKITEADQATFLEAWDDIQKHAAKRFNTAVIAEMGRRYQIRTIQHPVDLQKVIDTADTTGAAAEWRGFCVELTPDDDQLIVYSGLQSIYIQSVSLYRPEAGAAISGAIFDLLTGEQLATITFPVVSAAGWSRVSVEQRFSAYRIFIAYDSTTIDSPALAISPRVTGTLHASVVTLFGGSAYTNIRGCKSTKQSTVLEDDATKGNDSYGLSGVLAVQCSYEPLVENNKTAFIMPWAYMLGISLLWFRMHSTKINRFTIGFDREKAKEQMDDLEALFQQDLASVIDGIQMDLNDACLECNSTIQFHTSTP